MRFTGEVKRFTSKVKDEEQYEIIAGLGTQYTANQKLGQLEDIEDELGVDLITLFKAIRNGIYIRKPLEPTKIIYCKDVDIFRAGILVTRMVALFYDKIEYALSFKEYGKTWALTKEELTKEKEDE